MILFGIGASAQAAPVPCSRIIAEANRVVSRPGTTVVDPTVLARKLKVDQSWVERCLLVYGRQVGTTRRRPPEREIEDLDDAREAEEPEELSKEEHEYVHPRHYPEGLKLRKPTPGLGLEQDFFAPDFD